MVQLFKGDALELKMAEVGLAPANSIALSLDLFFQGAYSSRPLGEFLYDQNRIPLVNAIKREIFIQSFRELLDAFAYAGTLESYISLFKKIFGEDVQIEFTMQGPSGGLAEYAFIDDEGDFIVDGDGDVLYFGEPFAAGRLNIDIQTAADTEFNATIKEIFNEQYFESQFVDSDGDNLVFSSLLGIETESELRAIVFVLVPNGIYTEISLIIS